jgi:hypothetical protein
VPHLLTENPDMERGELADGSSGGTSPVNTFLFLADQPTRRCAKRFLRVNHCLRRNVAVIKTRANGTFSLRQLKYTRATMQPETTSPPLRADARAAFIRALAKHSAAIRDLRAWRPQTSQAAEFKQDVDAVSGTVPHLFSGHWGSISRQMLFDVAGAERVSGAAAWTLSWKLDRAPWLHKWAVFAILRWDIGRHCTIPNCPDGCVAADANDDVRALKLVAARHVLLTLGDERSNFHEILMAMNTAIDLRGGTPLTADEVRSIAEATIRSGTWLPVERRPVVGPLAGPHPLLETKDEYLQRTRSAWDRAIATLVEQGVSLRPRRKLELHCEWLVRHHIHNVTAAEILKGRVDTDPTTIYKAVKSMADLIDLPIRPSSET